MFGAFFTEYIGLPIAFTIKCGVGNKIEDLVLFLLNMSLYVF